MRKTLWLLFAAALVACSDSETIDDAGSVPDAGAGNDASAGGGDADVAIDAGPSAEDASVASDAGMSGDDAGMSGGDGGEAITGCIGAAYACVGRDPLACELGIGCELREACIGLASPCYTRGDPESCADVEGCSWDAALARCSGAQRACTTYTDSASCAGQPGCGIAPVCEGLATPCVALDEERCVTQLGCSWSDGG